MRMKCYSAPEGVPQNLLSALEAISDLRVREVAQAVERDEHELGRDDQDEAPRAGTKELPLKQLFKKRTLDDIEIVLLLGASVYVNEKRTLDVAKMTYFYFYALAQQSYGRNFVRFSQTRTYHNMRRRVTSLKATYPFTYACLKTTSFLPFTSLKRDAAALLTRLKVEGQALPRSSLLKAGVLIKTHPTKKRSLQSLRVQKHIERDTDKESFGAIDMLLKSSDSREDLVEKQRKLESSKASGLNDFQSSNYFQQMIEHEMGFEHHYLTQFRQDITKDVVVYKSAISSLGRSPATSAKITKTALYQNLLRGLFFLVTKEKNYSTADSLLKAILQYIRPEEPDHLRFMMYRAYLDFCRGNLLGADDLYYHLVKHLSDSDRQICVSLKLDVLVEHGRYERAVELRRQFIHFLPSESFVTWSRVVNANLVLSIVLDNPDSFRKLVVTELSSFNTIPNEENLSPGVLVNAFLFQLIKRYPQHMELIYDLGGTLLVGLFAHASESAMWSTYRTVRKISVRLPKSCVYDKMFEFGMAAYANGRCSLAERLLEKSLQRPHKTNKAQILLKLGQLQTMSGNHEKADQLLGLALSEAEAESGQGVTFATVLLYLGNSKAFQKLYDEALELYERAEKILKKGYGKNKLYSDLRVSQAAIMTQKGNHKEAYTLLTKARAGFGDYYGSQHFKSCGTSIALAHAFYESGNVTLSDECFAFAKSRILDEFSPEDPVFNAISGCSSFMEYMTQFVLPAQGDDHPLGLVLIYPRCYNTGSTFGSRGQEGTNRLLNEFQSIEAISDILEE